MMPLHGKARWCVWRSLILRLLLLLTATAPSSPQPPCPNVALRPVLLDIRPHNLTWKGGIITITGDSFGPRIVVSLGNNGRGGSEEERACSILSVNRTKLTCQAPPSEYGAVSVSASIDNCRSLQALPLTYAGWRWQDAWRWQTLITHNGEGGSPSPRMGHTLSADGYGNLVLYGGLTDAGVLGDAWMLSKQSGQQEQWGWTPLAAGRAPAARTEHVAAVVGGRLYVFGGWNAQMAPANSSAAAAADAEFGADAQVGDRVAAKFEQKTFALNLFAPSGTRVWTEVQTGDTQPLPRRGACAAATEDMGLVMFGGHDSESRSLELLDTQLFRLHDQTASTSAPSTPSSSFSWSLVELAASQEDDEMPPKLAYCSLAAMGGGEGEGETQNAQQRGGGMRLFLSGGMDETQELQHHIFVFVFGAAGGGSWRRLRGPAFAPGPAAVPARQMHLSAAVGERLLLFGGYTVLPPAVAR